MRRFALTLRSTQALTANGLLAIVVNEADPLSVRIGDYYARTRHIPAQRIIRVRLGQRHEALSSTASNAQRLRHFCPPDPSAALGLRPFASAASNTCRANFGSADCRSRRRGCDSSR